MAFEPQEDWPHFKSYKPLNPALKEIRVLELLPGDGPIELNLVHLSLLSYADTVNNKVITKDFNDLSIIDKDNINVGEGHGKAKDEAENDHEAQQDDKDAYTALSYCWGPRSELRPVSIDNEEVQLRRTVWAFLHSVRIQSKGVLTRIWLDIICINQRDVNEKNSQVSMMRDIYRHAKQTLVWLDEASNLTDLAFDFFAYYHSYWCRMLGDDWLEVFCGLKDLDDSYWKHEDRDGVPCWIELGDLFRRRDTFELKLKLPLSLTKHFGLERTSIAWSAIEEVFSRPYWSRVWVIQEILLAKDCYLLCGDRGFSARILPPLFEDRRFIWSDLQTVPDREEAMQKSLIPIQVVFRPSNEPIYEHEGSDLATLLDIFDHSACSEPRDKIYGLRALLHPDQEARLEVDYQISLLELWMQSALAMQKRTTLGFSGNIFGTAALRHLWELWKLNTLCTSADDLSTLQSIENPVPFVDAALAGVVISRQDLLIGSASGTIFESSQRLVGGEMPADYQKANHVICCSLETIWEGDICLFGLDSDQGDSWNDEERSKDTALLDFYHLVIIRWQNGKFIFVGTAKCYMVPLTMSTKVPSSPVHESSQHHEIRDYIWKSLHEFIWLGKPDFEPTQKKKGWGHEDKDEYQPWDQVKTKIDERLKDLWYSDEWAPYVKFKTNIAAFIYMIVRVQPSTEPVPGCSYLTQIRLTLPSAEQGKWRRMVSKRDAGIRKVRDLRDKAEETYEMAKMGRKLVNMKLIKAKLGRVRTEEL